MKTILVPLDGSTLAEQVLPSVRALAPILGARVQLLHIVSEADRYHFLADDESISEAGVPSARSAHTGSWEPLRQNAEDYLNTQAAALSAAGVETGVSVLLGWPAEAIVEAAAREHVALIAMATHGYSGLKRWALGSVTDKVVHATATPVLVVRGAATGEAADRPLKRILVPLDGSALARQALPLAAELAICARAELILLTVALPPALVAPELMSPLPQFDETLDALQEQLKNELGPLAARLEREQVRVTTIAVSGFPAETIVDTAAQYEAGLILMATHGSSGLRRWALGSVADKVLHATSTPLILVRAQE